MWDVLSALIPPAVVATAFCTFIYKLLRKEMAPRTSDGRLVSEADTASSSSATVADSATTARADDVTADGGAKTTPGASTEVSGDGAGSDGR
ncbi:hypothetical protein [Marinactinospora rubrisoli]|uniref:Uncharacterized protein n=1 Tax=Marinactinospora rubrisoli TaxID=2715399 RepID=A0ABW2KH34_9ACTN